MGATIAPASPAGHRVIPEITRVAAKADLRQAEILDLRPVIGACILRARQARGWTLDEFAGQLPAPAGAAARDARQVRRWEEGTERAQFDILFGCADEEFVGLLVVQLAPLARRVDVQTVITLRRSV